MTNLATGLATRNRQDDQRAILLASMRAAIHNLRSWQAELEVVGVALTRGQITLPTACDWLDEIGVLRWMPPPVEVDHQEVA